MDHGPKSKALRLPDVGGRWFFSGAVERWRLALRLARFVFRRFGFRVLYLLFFQRFLRGEAFDALLLGVVFRDHFFGSSAKVFLRRFDAVLRVVDGELQ